MAAAFPGVGFTTRQGTAAFGVHAVAVGYV
jgi:hypothetical protein